MTGLPLVLFPIWSCLFLLINRDRLPDEDYQTKYEGLYGNLKINYKVHSLHVFFYPTIFTIRRVSYVIIALLKFPTNGFYFNISLLIVTSVLYWSWLGNVRPFQSRKLLGLEIFNELMILFLVYHLFCFTDLTDVYSQVHSIMHSFEISMIFLICVNFLFMSFDIYSQCKLWYLQK